MTRYRAILLIGPTGSGKTPLGNLLEKNGFKGARCFHFDFGENLRKIANDSKPDIHFSKKDIDFINKVLDTGALLENEDFHIARKIIDSFISRKDVSDKDLIILNGLPRHIGQADDVDSILDIEMVIYLSGAAEIIFHRIRNNAGGDRAGRIDDDLESIKDKLEIFTRRTGLLIDYYRSRGIGIETVNIRQNTTAEDVYGILSRLKKRSGSF
ncbi:MAG: nucleoside monophosphate kinase [Planctomycetota bacterium]